MDSVLQFLNGWSWLTTAIAIYVAIISFGGVAFTFPSYDRYKRTHPRRHRMFLAAYLALVFTPSILSDFWLFSIPAPATFGLLVVAPGLLFSGQRLDALIVIVMFYLLPLLVGFVIFYAVLSLCGWCRARRSKHGQVAYTTPDPN